MTLGAFHTLKCILYVKLSYKHNVTVWHVHNLNVTVSKADSDVPKELSHLSSVSELSVELFAADDRLSHERCGGRCNGVADILRERSPIRGSGSGPPPVVAAAVAAVDVDSSWQLSHHSGYAALNLENPSESERKMIFVKYFWQLL